ncbi:MULTISPECIES: hypothetical protein [unclassified Caballeronia]|uniref:hypothetical protein n=1 Tax=unclassified Caballeronia TaxID=2646786 RepID=UPI001F37D4D4|nr:MULTISPECIES: hypothetical protein [unclassified Caballeronia]MCE4547224.1 hypothetical protein [Caballeronia sp. PC1]MCE4575205.1 hypothetical protein [Caballeronia sp. CLC5]
MSIHSAGWAAIVAAAGVGMQFYIARRSLKQAEKISRDTLDVQRVSTARTASTFIAEKRQKWIDDLRGDVSRYVSLTLEIAEGWKALFSKLGEEHDKRWDQDPQGVFDFCETQRKDFVAYNAKSLSEQHQIQVRIVLRLNKVEDAHKGLLDAINALRVYLHDLERSAEAGKYDAKETFDSMARSIDIATNLTNVILRQEWVRLKREVAAPEQLILDILDAKMPDHAAVEAAKENREHSVASILSGHVLLHKSFSVDGLAIGGKGGQPNNNDKGL